MADYTLENIKKIDRGVNKLLATVREEKEARVYQEIATTVTSKNRTESYTWLGDIPTMKEWIDERQKAKLSDYKYDIEKKDWETSIYVTRDDVMFDNLGAVKAKVEMLDEAVDEHYDEIVANLILDNGVCFDGKKYFDTHTIGEDTYTNISNYKLTPDNLFTVVEKMKAIKKPNGRPARVKPKTVLIGPGLLKAVRTALLSEKIDGSDNPAYNLLKYKEVDDMEPGTWCVIDDSRAVKPFILQITKKADKIDRLTQNPLEGKMIYYGVDTMDNAGYSFWQLAHFCDGTETVAAE